MKFDLKKPQTKKTIYFVGVMIGVFGLSFIILDFVGFVPKPLNLQNIITDADLPKNRENLPGTLTRPDKIVIEKIGVNSKVLQPDSVNVTVLDETLKKGAAYYPGSGTIEQGNIFIFGHSTNWPVVQNQAYKTFNGLDKLVKGDTITLGAGEQNFSYKVTSVELVDSNNSLVKFDNSGQTLTLSTCNTFGQKQERWVVKAEKI
jgi:LPXTG-site transpeptidase (sortase) family protein